MSGINRKDWRGLNVYRDRRHENLIKTLVEDKDTAIFTYNKDLMVFAAMIGYSYNKKLALSDDKISISLGTYYNSEDDGFIYLLALMENKNATCLKAPNLASSIRIFEEYGNGGLDLIQDWFRSNPTDISRVETIETKIWEYIKSQEAAGVDISNDDLEVDF
ncbi:DNA phosphorothioation-associated protein 4 [Psychrobacter faecalis]